MTVVTRRIIAIPQRSAIDAWGVIINLTAGPDSEAHRELKSVEGIAASIVTDEAAKNSPIVFYGSGPRVRFYCLYDEDAIAGDQASEANLGHCPTENEWKVSLPCRREDLEWVRAALLKKSQRITAREIGTEVAENASSQSAAANPSATINSEAFYRS